MKCAKERKEKEKKENKNKNKNNNNNNNNTKKRSKNNKSPIRCLGDLIKGVFYLIISYLRIKIYNVLNYNNCSTDWIFL